MCAVLGTVYSARPWSRYHFCARLMQQQSSEFSQEEEQERNEEKRRAAATAAVAAEPIVSVRLSCIAVRDERESANNRSVHILYRGGESRARAVYY